MAGIKMAMLQEVDKCIRCNGCYIACKRTWKMRVGDFTNMTTHTRGVHRVDSYQRVVIKSQKRLDMGPFIRYSCWHCENPPCAGRCPFGAIKKQDNGAVAIDFAKCNPNSCQRQCVADCQRGGYPKVGAGDMSGNYKAFKCTMCYGRSGYRDASGNLKGDLPTKLLIVDASGNPESPVYTYLLAQPASTARTNAIAKIDASGNRYVPELQHQPTCVYTCPAKAMWWDTAFNIGVLTDYMSATAATDASGRKLYYKVGSGGMIWVSRAWIIASPKADPYIEDHVTPMVSGLLSSPLAKAAIVPTLVVGGLMAVSARRSENEKEAELAMEGEV